MADRYINTSEMTTHIAKGILIYARLQNMPAYWANPAQEEWESWKRQFPKWADFVQKEQFDLFDRINNYRQDHRL